MQGCVGQGIKEVVEQCGMTTCREEGNTGGAGEEGLTILLGACVQLHFVHIMGSMQPSATNEVAYSVLVSVHDARTCTERAGS